MKNSFQNFPSTCHGRRGKRRCFIGVGPCHKIRRCNSGLKQLQFALVLPIYRYSPCSARILSLVFYIDMARKIPGSLPFQNNPSFKEHARSSAEPIVFCPEIQWVYIVFGPQRSEKKRWILWGFSNLLQLLTSKWALLWSSWDCSSFCNRWPSCCTCWPNRCNCLPSVSALSAFSTLPWRPLHMRVGALHAPWTEPDFMCTYSTSPASSKHVKIPQSSPV